MAPSAAPSLKQSYSAGNCRLDLVIQPSALSQWHPQLIATQVEFKLWMREAQGAEPTLVAEGDRITLQAIAHHIEHRTQAVLLISQASDRSTTSAPQIPEGTQLPHPLSYLQLCDLLTVLTQCEQATKPLPVALPVAPPVELSIAPPPAPPATVPQRKGKLIFFPTGRRVAWASSAAAALFAVGLTTTLWNKTPAPQTASTTGADSAEPNITHSDNKRLRLNKSDEELSAALPNNASPSERNRAQTAQRPNSTTQRPARPANASGQSNSSTNNPAAASRPSASSVSPKKSTAIESAPSSASTEGSSNSSDSSQNLRRSNESTADSIAAAPAPASRQAPDSARDQQVAAASDTESLEPASLSAPSNQADGLPTLEPTSPQASARRSNDEINGAIAPSNQTAEAPAISQATISKQESETIAQVRNYFVNRWRPNENLSAPLSYQLQLSSVGEVVSFIALTEGGGVYRDRLLPDSTLSFPTTNSAALANGLTLKITLTPSGQVQIEKM